MPWRRNGDQTVAGTANPFFNGSAFFRGYGKELSGVLVDMSCAAAGTSHIAFFVLCQGENDFEGLLAIFAEEFIARHGDLQKRSSDTILLLAVPLTAPREGLLVSAQSRRDQAVGFVGGNKDFIAVLDSKTGNVKGQVVFIWQRKPDLAELGATLECGFSHRVERMLDRLTGMVRERL